jgi:ankyrin repeat protein
MDAFEHQVIQPLIRKAQQGYHRWDLIQNPNRRGIDRPLTTTGLTALHLAYKLGDWDAMEALRKLGANPNVQDSYKGTVLHMAVEDKNRDTVEYFLRDWKADFDVEDSNFNRPFDLAILYADREMVEIFMQYGAEFTPSTLGQAASNSVDYSGHYGVMLMLDLGYDPNTRDSDGWTTLHHACREYYSLGLLEDSIMVERLQVLMLKMIRAGLPCMS